MFERKLFHVRTLRRTKNYLPIPPSRLASRLLSILSRRFPTNLDPQPLETTYFRKTKDYEGEDYKDLEYLLSMTVFGHKYIVARRAQSFYGSRRLSVWCYCPQGFPCPPGGVPEPPRYGHPVRRRSLHRSSRVE